MTTRLGYHPALDGIRAISILAVMLYHSGLFHGGFLGVDVFFTLSGFLITTLLIEERAAGGRIALRDLRARWLLVAGLLLAALGSILLRYHLAVSGATGRRFYLGTDAHADPILIGCATACLVSWGYIRGGSNPSASTRWRWQAAALA